jgi:hypothetical protein
MYALIDIGYVTTLKECYIFNSPVGFTMKTLKVSAYTEGNLAHPRPTDYGWKAKIGKVD